MNFFLLLIMSVVVTFGSETGLETGSEIIVPETIDSETTINNIINTTLPRIGDTKIVEDQILTMSTRLEHMSFMLATLQASLPKPIIDDNEPKEPVILFNTPSAGYYLNAIIVCSRILKSQCIKLFADYTLFIKLIGFVNNALLIYSIVFLGGFIISRPIALLFSKNSHSGIIFLFRQFFKALPELLCAGIYLTPTFLQNVEIVEIKTHYLIQLILDPLFSQYICLASFMCLGIFSIKILNSFGYVLKKSFSSWNVYQTFAIQLFFARCTLLILNSFVVATEYSGAINFCKEIKEIEILLTFIFTAIFTVRLQRSTNFGNITITKAINYLALPILGSAIFAYASKSTEAVFMYRLLLSLIIIPIFERLYFIIRLITFEYIKGLPRAGIRYLIRLFIIFVTGLRFAIMPLSLGFMMHIFGINILNEIKFLVIKSGFMSRILLIFLLIVVVAISRIINLYFWSAYEQLESIARPFDKQRIETFATLFKNLVAIFMYIITLFVLLSLLGIDVSPLFQSVGFMSAALSFSLQEFIRDIVNGLLFFYDNSIKVGDLIEYEKRTAVVEIMSIRYVRIRFDDGLLITIPFHRLDPVRNKSRQQSYIILNISFARNVDIKLAEDAIREAFNNVRDQPEYKYKVLKELEMRDVAEVTAFSYVMQCRICVQPNSQYKVKRALNKEIKNLLDKYSIDLAFPPVANAINSPSLSTGDTFPDFQ